MTSNHGSSTQLYTPPPWCCQHHCPTTRLSSSQTDVLKGREGRTLTRITYSLPRKLSEWCYKEKSSGSTEKQIPWLHLPNHAWLSTRAQTPSCKEAMSDHSFYHSWYVPSMSPLSSRLSHSTAGRRETLIHLKRKHVPGVFTPSTF